MKLDELKENLRWIDDEIESIKREQAALERSAPFDLRKMFPVGLFLLGLGISFVFTAYQGVQYQLNIVLVFLSALFAVCLIYVGANLTRIGYKFNRTVRRGERIFAKAEKIRERLENEIAKEQ
jgi:hypothetical protein